MHYDPDGNVMEDVFEAHKFSNNHMEQLKKTRAAGAFIVAGFIRRLKSLIG